MKREILFFCLTTWQTLQHNHVVEKLHTPCLVVLGLCLLVAFVTAVMIVLYILLSQIQ